MTTKSYNNQTELNIRTKLRTKLRTKQGFQGCSSESALQFYNYPVEAR